MAQQEKVFKMLKDLNINYELIHHRAAITIDDINDLKLDQYGDVCKNLFLRDANGKRHFLISLIKDKTADIKNIQKQLGCTRLSFASDDRLHKHLQLKKGEVTPLAVINDPDCAVEIVLDNDLCGKNKLGFHPNDNTATVIISYEDLIRVIEHNGNRIHYVTI